MRSHRHRPWTWAAAAFVTVASLTVTTLGGAQADNIETFQTAAALADPPVEDEGADCRVGQGGSANTSMLPDPFTKMDGTRVTTKEDWRCRRAEIKELAERTVYGDKPAKPDSVTGTVSSSRITVNVSHQGRTASFSANVQLPSGSGPHPAVIVYGGFGADTATIRNSGAAVISYDPFAVGQEGTGRNNKSGAFYSIYGAQSGTGLLGAWAWGVSRIIDVIESSGGSVLRADATGVTGCSRYGKGAFVAGAFDQRIALTMPIESGSGGVGAFRSIARESGAQPLSSAYGEQPWLGDAFGSYTGNPNSLPVDTHEVVGMIAPRGLLIMDNPHVEWLGAQSGAVAALGGAEVYKALGAQQNISYWSDVSDGTHCANRSEWRGPIQQSIQKFLLNTGSAPGVFRISAKKSANLSQWRNWQTPTLTDGGGNGGTTAGNNGGTTAGNNGGGDNGGTTAGNNGGSGNATCTATLEESQRWGDRFNVQATVRAGSTSISNWTVNLQLNGGQSIQNSWSASFSTSGSNMTVRPSGNGTLAAGASTGFGFTVMANGNWNLPRVVGCTAS
ncbi:cellulose binding domain-containing protein [Streptomyces sp. TRM 70361]|uniref:glucuronyl esterase domain-containing protein n=1 Tax=Streptomyces sp. TRM 70361 TaxID=3116553 RepID=UPI002E7B201F|nr:cellulose binding domain-containing protein [Streptomyces sp. TRM 70361]MEE1942413.1 cellulose binding domain-containing protein [Streptomyces sp. TRM 70361]